MVKFKKYDMKTMGIILCFSILLSNCNKLFKDEELSLQRVSYIGEELRVDGYYYFHWASYDSPFDNNTSVKFFYRNGLVLSAHSYGGIDLDNVEKEMVDLYDKIRKDKIGWGVFIVNGDEIQCEQWTSSVGGGLPIYKWSGKIENDTTFRHSDSNETWHFKKFTLKPDSTNNFIP
ncbi:MAG: hypothetical protein LBM08_03005 [Dysgonamonadaceae bacterium]|jgi:hypothetical protein|nr:hypothetical protein [Dysgonamonadaceae bacterium]